MLSFPNRRALLAASLLAVGCGELDEDTNVCDASPELSISANLPRGGNSGHSADVELVGATSNDDGVAIRTLELELGLPGGEVLTFPATSTNDNFRAWEATLPIGALVDAQAEANRPEGLSALAKLVTVEAKARDACGETQREVLGTLSVDIEATLEVSELEIERPTFPTDVAALPADGSQSVLVQVTASVDAAGATVALSGEGLRVEESSRRFELNPERTRSEAFFSVRAADGTSAGTKFLVAESKEESANRALDVIGSPNLTPLSWELEPGGSVPLSAASPGDADISCSAVASDGLAVTSGTTDLRLGPGGIDSDGDGRIDIIVEAADDAEPGASATVRCTDPFGQTSSQARVNVVPGEEPSGP